VHVAGGRWHAIGDRAEKIEGQTRIDVLTLEKLNPGYIEYREIGRIRLLRLANEDGTKENQQHQKYPAAKNRNGAANR
jgi:hypothetical protein